MIDRIQWHLGFRGAIKTELSKEDIPFEYRDEYAINKKELKSDLIVIHKKSEKKPKNSIGHIFKTINVMEYKSPEDNLLVKDFYRTLAYTYGILSTSTESLCNKDTVTIEEITLSLVCSHFPRKLMKHFTESLGLKIEKHCPGIFYVLGGFFSIQIVYIPHLDLKEHAWLKVLFSNVGMDVINQISAEYNTQDPTDNADAVLEIMFRANPTLLQKEMINMSEELKQQVRILFKDEIDAGILALQKKHTLNMLKNGFSYEDILKVLGDDVDLSTIKEWEAELLAAQT